MKMIKIFILTILFIPILTLAQNNWLLSANGLGPIKLGMTIKQIEKVTHASLEKTEPDTTHENKSCFVTSFTDKTLAGVSLMISNGKLVRINVSSNHYPTTTGIRIGDSEEDVQNHYDYKIDIAKHQYDPNGHYLTYMQKQKKRGIRFETNGKDVTLMYAGLKPQLYFVEDCL